MLRAGSRANLEGEMRADTHACPEWHSGQVRTGCLRACSFAVAYFKMSFKGMEPYQLTRNAPSAIRWWCLHLVGPQTNRRCRVRRAEDTRTHSHRPPCGC
ncbi:hypothetical protein C8T65DRAFT_33948 [Cerioporus squamosus]|nr:hypothetical protein C8T65DRAFT_33948 [Cerioporus squamosus]